MASSKRTQHIISVSYRCTDCGALFGDPERKQQFSLWLADVVSHWIGRHGLNVQLGQKDAQTLNQLMRPVYVWVLILFAMLFLSACSPLRGYKFASHGPNCKEKIPACSSDTGDITHASEPGARIVVPKKPKP